MKLATSILLIALALTAAPALSQGQMNLLGVNSQSGAVQVPAAQPAAPVLGPTAPRQPYKPEKAWSGLPQPLRFGAFFGVGILKGIGAMVEGTAEMISHPIETLKGIGSLITNPGQIVTGVSNWVGRLGEAAKNDPDTFAEMLGEGTFTAVSTVAGGYGAVKGVSGLVRTARGARTAALAGTVDDLANAGRTSRTAAAVAETPRAPVLPTAVPRPVAPTVAPRPVTPTVAPRPVTPTAAPTRVPPTVAPTRVPPTVAPTPVPTRAPVAPTPVPTPVPTRVVPPTVRPPNPKLVEAIGPADSVLTTARTDSMITRPIQRLPNYARNASEFPYRLPKKVVEIQPGKPLDLSAMKPGEKWLYVVREDGVIVACPEAQAGFGRTIKHRDLVPDATGHDGLPARYAGEMVRLPDGRIYIDGNSSYVFARKNTASLLAGDGLPQTGPLQAVRELFESTGTPVETTRRFLF